MSWANVGDDEKPMIKRSSNPQARSDSLSTVMSNDDDLNRILESAEHESIADGDKNAINEDVKQVHEVIIKDDMIKKQWDNGRIPHFPVMFSFCTKFSVEVAKTFPHLNFFVKSFYFSVKVGLTEFLQKNRAFTIWKLQKSSANQILREISFEDLRSSKTNIFAVLVSVSI